MFAAIYAMLPRSVEIALLRRPPHGALDAGTRYGSEALPRAQRSR